MAGKRIYQQDRYAAENTTRVTEVTCRDGFDVIACEASVFYPEGGGQPSDTGTVTSEKGVFGITRAFDRDLAGDVWHITDAPEGTFSEGDEVRLEIDFERRFLNMQRHLGEHMLSGAMHRLFGGVNRGFHMGDSCITIDIDLDGRMLTEEELELAEKTVNDAIWADLPVTVTWFDDYEASLAMPVRKAVPHDGRISVVTVGDIDDPFDCIACCGTHPARSSEVGLLAIYKCEPNKGMNRIYFDCGIAAKEKLTRDSRMLSDIAKLHSCSTADLPSRLELEAANVSELKERLAAMAGYIRETESARIISEIRSEGAGRYVYGSDILSPDELLKTGFRVINECSGLFLIMKHPASCTCLLFSSGGIKCGETVKKNAGAFSGRGGGRDDNARALFGNRADMEAFIAKVTE